MTPLRTVFLAALGFFAVAPNCFPADLTPIPFAQKLEEIRAQANLPALGGVASIDGTVKDLTVTGVRRQGSSIPVTTEDLWHIGSITKSMTATLAGVLVDQGRIQWDSTVSDVLGRGSKVSPQWRDVTLTQLLQHRGGAPAKPPEDLWAIAWKQIGTPRQQRSAFVSGLLQRPPESQPGSTFQYSNQGYSVAGAMQEKVMNEPWEKLMRKYVFEPLEMKTASFGPPGKPGKTDEPLGHTGTSGALTPVEVGPSADNPAAIGPGGIVHCSLSDLIRYAQWHADGGVHSPKLQLKPETFARLHEPPPGGDYAFGWNVTSRPWANGIALTHNGTNMMWFAVVWISPARKAAFAAVTNAAGDTAAKACDSTVAALIQRHLQ